MQWDLKASSSVPRFGEDTIKAGAPARQSGLQMGRALRLTRTSKKSTWQIPDQRNDRPEGKSSPRCKVNDDSQRWDQQAYVF